MRLLVGRDRLFVGRAALLGALAMTLAVACGDGDDDSILLQEGDPNQPGTGGTSGDGAPSGSGGSAGSGDSARPDDLDGEEPTGSAGSAGAGGAPNEPAPLTEDWEDGVTVNGVSDTVDDRFHGVTLDANNNAIAVGYIGNGTGDGRSVLVARYTSAGVPDATFGDEGIVQVDLSPYLGTPADAAEPDTAVEEGRDVVVQSDGKIVVVARSEDPTVADPDVTTPIDIVLFRLNEDGTRDLTFGTDGLTILNPGGGINELAWGIDIDANDRLYVFGHGTATNPPDAETPRTDQDRYVWRLNVDGSLDTSFGTDGFFTFDVPQGTAGLGLNDNQRFGVVMADGRIASGGYTNVAGRNQIVLLKLLEDGTPDPAFSGDGIVRLAPFATGMAEAYGVAVQSDGSFVTTGYGNPDVERAGGAELLDMVSFRVRPDGSADPTWGVNGALVYDPGGAQDRGRALEALPDDRVMFAGAVTVVGDDKDAMLLLVDQNGRPARNFDTEVHKAYDFGGNNEEFFALDVGTEFVVAAGYAAGGTLANGNAVLVILPVGE